MSIKLSSRVPTLSVLLCASWAATAGAGEVRWRAGSMELPVKSRAEVREAFASVVSAPSVSHVLSESP